MIAEWHDKERSDAARLGSVLSSLRRGGHRV